MYRDRVRMRDLVVLLPGITGSILQKDGRDTWALSLRAIFGVVASRGNNLKQLKLIGDDPTVDDLEDGIVATSLIQDACILPGLVKIDGYTRLSQMIRDNFDVRDGSIDLKVNPYPPGNYLEFPYDWRRDNRVAGRQLEKLISCRLKQWRAFAGEDAKVILLAHSMGGIIARHYLEVLEGWKDCRALITFGTPFRGSVKALDCLANGCAKGFIELTEIVRTFTSVYQLLPDYRVVRVGDEWRHIADIDHKEIDRDRASKAALFHQDIREHVEARIRGNGTSYVLSPVVGTYQPTLQSAEIVGSNLTVSDVLPPQVDELVRHGDGTVPYLSAIPSELLRAHRNTFFAECHSSIHCNDQCLEFIYSQLQDLQITGLEDLRGGGPDLSERRRSVISLSTPELCQHGDPVIIRVRVLMNDKVLTDPQQYQNQIGSLNALITGVDTNVRREFVFQNQEDEAVVTTEPLLPGLYRLEVRAARTGPLAPRPVHDLFQVATGP